MNSPKLSSGIFLIARDILDGSYFEKRVIFLAEHSDSGSYGLIVNFPVNMPLNEVFTGLEKESRKSTRFFMGGPVQEDRIQIVQTGFSTVNHASEVFPGLFLGGTWENEDGFLEKLLSQDNLRIFLGYAGWAPKQLESELEQGCWDILKVSPLRVFSATDKDIALAPHEFRNLYNAEN